MQKEKDFEAKTDEELITEIEKLAPEEKDYEKMDDGQLLKEIAKAEKLSK